MKIDFSNDAEKAFGKLDSNMAGRIIKGIMKLPNKGDIKPLSGYSDGRKRLRIGGYRIIFLFENNFLQIIEIDSRGDIYK